MNKALLAAGGAALVVGGLAWYFTQEHKVTSPVPCSIYTDSESCSRAGCYWWDNSCHNTPEGAETFNVVGQAVYTIEGVVQGPLAGVKVSVTNIDTGKIWVSYSDSGGSWGIDDVTEGTYKLVASKKGYVTVNWPWLKWTKDTGFWPGGTYDVWYMYTTLEKIISVDLEWSGSATYSVDFPLDPPITVNRMTGVVDVDDLWMTDWRVVDIWIYPVYGDPVKIVDAAGWVPWDSIVHVAESFTERSINKVRVWGGGGMVGQPAHVPALRDIDLVIKKEL